MSDTTGSIKIGMKCNKLVKADNHRHVALLWLSVLQQSFGFIWQYICEKCSYFKNIFFLYLILFFLFKQILVATSMANKKVTLNPTTWKHLLCEHCGHELMIYPTDGMGDMLFNEQ